MHPTAPEAARHLEDLSAAVIEAVADPSHLPALPSRLTDLHKAFVVRFEPVRPPAGLVAKSVAKQMVWGWASVATLNGEPLIDLQGDHLPIEELQKAVHEFMGSRAGDVMHDGVPAGEIVDSLCVTKALSDAMGWYPGREGWFVGYKIASTDVWNRVLSGELKAFSIAGDALSTPITEA